MSEQPNQLPLSVTKEHIESIIKKVAYNRVMDTTTTIAAIVLENGFVVIGESACANPELFNEQLGQQLALDDAIRKVWMLEGYLLREAYYEQERAVLEATAAEANTDAE